MTKHNYIVYGIICDGEHSGKYFKSTCVSIDILALINYYYSEKMSPTSIIKKEQVHIDRDMHEMEIKRISYMPLDLHLN